MKDIGSIYPIVGRNKLSDVFFWRELDVEVAFLGRLNIEISDLRYVKVAFLVGTFL